MSLPLICIFFPIDAAGSILDGSLLAAKQSNYTAAVQVHMTPVLSFRIYLCVCVRVCCVYVCACPIITRLPKPNPTRHALWLAPLTHVW